MVTAVTVTCREDNLKGLSPLISAVTVTNLCDKIMS